MGPEQTFFIAYHSVNFIIFAVAVVYAGMTVSKLRKTSATYKSRLLPFAYFSLSAWILWALQYLILVASPFISFPSGFLLDTGLWLGLMQTALWASAVLALNSKQFSRVSQSLPPFIIVVAWPLFTYRTAVLSSEPFLFIDAVSAAVIFTSFALFILQWRLSKIYAAFFLIHGYSQWIWRSLWFTPGTGTQITILMAFPLWRIALLFAWIKLISEMVERAEASLKEVVTEIEKRSLVALAPFHVMIASTVEDLERERDAAEGAIVAMHLQRLRAENLGSVVLSPRELCELMAKECDIFLLIIGERYGHVFEPEGISVVEFEFRKAYDDDRRKILVYVKDGVKRDPRLEEFLKRVHVFEQGYFTSFITPEELYEKIQRNIMRWLTSHMKQK